MLIGLVADIHEDVENLKLALAQFQRHGVELVVNLGDACDTFSNIGRSRETVELLRAASAVGVWGNHDFGLCQAMGGQTASPVEDEVMKQAPAEVLEFMATMQPQLSIDGCRFSHVEPWLNPTAIEDLWYYDGPPDTIEKAARSFDVTVERFLFVGHLHRWLAMSPSGRVDWCGEKPLKLRADERYLIAIAAVVCGWCATFETRELVLTPLRCCIGEPSFK